MVKRRHARRKKRSNIRRKKAYLERLLSAIKLIDLHLKDEAIAESLNFKNNFVGTIRQYYAQHGKSFIKLIKLGDILHDEKFAFKDNSIKE